MNNRRSLPRNKNILGPVLAMAMLTVLLSACSTPNDANVTQPTDADTTQPMIRDEDDITNEDTNDDANATSSVPAAASSSGHQEAAIVNKKYSDGTYAATGEYRSPAGSEQVEVSLTLKDDTIVDATFAADSSSGRSKQYMAKFAEGFKEQVVGKSIDGLSLGVVNGSSLTPKGFMDAVRNIKEQASA